MTIRSLAPLALLAASSLAALYPGAASSPAARNVAPAAQQIPEIRLEGRDSLTAMERFEPFLGVWRFVESPPGTALEGSFGVIYFRRIMEGLAIESSAGPESDPIPGFQVLWHPIEHRYLFRKFEPRNPTDLMFEGEYEFLDDHTLLRTYTGYYGDGRIHRYRERFTIGPPNRLTTTTEQLKEGRWQPIFDTFVAERIADPASANHRPR